MFSSSALSIIDFCVNCSLGFLCRFITFVILSSISVGFASMNSTQQKRVILPVRPLGEAGVLAAVDVRGLHLQRSLLASVLTRFTSLKSEIF